MKDAIYVRLQGRMGNNMFQLATAASLAHEMGLECYACPNPRFWTAEPDNCFLPKYVEKYKSTLFRNFQFIDTIPYPFKIYRENEFAYNPLPQIKNIYLMGYFQSEKYFHYPLVRSLFQMDTVMESKLWERYGKLLDLHPVSINVRRGDYLKVSDCHPVQTMEYFRAAIEYMGIDRHFLITSDDTEWCKENFIGENMHVVEDVDPVENLYLQSMCMDHIISNSTYSWWGAWLDDKQDSIVVYPKQWFGPQLSHLSTKDLFPSRWVMISK